MWRKGVKTQFSGEGKKGVTTRGRWRTSRQTTSTARTRSRQHRGRECGLLGSHQEKWEGGATEAIVIPAFEITDGAVILFTGTPLKVPSVRLHSKSRGQDEHWDEGRRWSRRWHQLGEYFKNWLIDNADAVCRMIGVWRPKRGKQGLQGPDRLQYRLMAEKRARYANDSF